MEWFTAFGSALGGAIIPVALFLFILRGQSTSIKEVEDGLEKKVDREDCEGQPCDDIKVIQEVMQGKPGKVGMVARLENIENVVVEIREHQVNGGQ